MNAKMDNAVIALAPTAIARDVTTVPVIAISAVRDIVMTVHASIAIATAVTIAPAIAMTVQMATVRTVIAAMITAVTIATTARKSESLG